MNHPHEQQAAAMTRAGELPDGEQLRECINSGQVSAAQVVAIQAGWKLVPIEPTKNMLYEIHENAHILPPRGKRIWKMMLEAAPKAPHQKAGELPKPKANVGEVFWCNEPIFTQDQLDALLAAERAEVARLRVALEGAYALVLNLNRNKGATNHD